MAGASGFLGSNLAADLTAAGHDVIRLVRRPTRRTGEVAWQPARRQLDAGALAGADAVINLAGAGINDRRWTAAYKRELRASRLDTTATLAAAIAGLPPADRPAALLNGSGISCYGHTGDRPVTEESPLGEGFLPELCRDWEAATDPAERAGVRVALLRTAPVLHRDGGLLKPQLLAYKLGVAGPIAGGRQAVPWISLVDWLAAVRFVLTGPDLAGPDLAGPVNLVSPHQVTNAEFTKALGAALHRPTIVPIPGIALRAVLGGMSVEVVGGSRAVPAVLTGAGFVFRHPDLASALRYALTDDVVAPRAV